MRERPRRVRRQRRGVAEQLAHRGDHHADRVPLGHRPQAVGQAAGRDECVAEEREHIDEEVATGEFPHLSELLPPGGMAELWAKIEDSASDEQRFERGLRRMLDGIQLELEGGR